MSAVSISMPPRVSRPPVVAVRPPVALRNPDQEAVALASDPDWEDEFPTAKASPPPEKKQPKNTSKHPASKLDFIKLEEAGSLLARRLGWGPLQGVAIRESGQIAAQRYGFSEKTDAHIAEEAFSLLLAAI